MSTLSPVNKAKTETKSSEIAKPFEVKVEVAQSTQNFEALNYPQSSALIGAAVQQHLCFDFREYSHGTFTGIDRINRSIIVVDDIAFLTKWSLTLGQTNLKPGSTKISSSILLVLAVSAYNGIASYPDFKRGLAELFEDIDDISKAYSVEFSIPVRDGPNEYQPDIELFMRDEEDIICAVKTAIRRANDTSNNGAD